MKTPDFSAYTRDHWSCLLYVETVVVDHGGVPDHRKMNAADRDALDGMERDGLIIWGGTGLNPVFSLTDTGWAVAGSIRRHRAEKKAPTISRATVATRAHADAVRSSETPVVRRQAKAIVRGYDDEYEYPRLSVEDVDALSEAMMQISDIINMAAGDLDGCSCLEQVEETREAMAAASKVVTKWRVKAARAVSAKALKS